MKYIPIAILLISKSLFPMLSQHEALIRTVGKRSLFTLEERAQRIAEAYKIHLPTLQELYKQLAEEMRIKRVLAEDVQNNIDLLAVNLRED